MILGKFSWGFLSKKLLQTRLYGIELPQDLCGQLFNLHHTGLDIFLLSGMMRINSLCTFPEMGRAVAQAPDPNSIRDFVFGKYIVRYTVHDAALVILRIWHHFEHSRGSS